MLQVASVTIEHTASDYEAVAFSEASAVGLTATKVRPTGARPRRSAFLSFETGGVNFRYCYDGTTPTSTIGHLAEDGFSMVLEGEVNLAKLKFILVSAGTGSAKVTYHG